MLADVGKGVWQFSAWLFLLLPVATSLPTAPGTARLHPLTAPAGYRKAPPHKILDLPRSILRISGSLCLEPWQRYLNENRRG